MHQLSPIDAALLVMERPRTPFHVSMINIYDPSTCPGKAPTFDDIVEAVRISLPAAPSFRRKIVRVPLDLDYPYWIEDAELRPRVPHAPPGAAEARRTGSSSARRSPGSSRARSTFAAAVGDDGDRGARRHRRPPARLLRQRAQGPPRRDRRRGRASSWSPRSTSSVPHKKLKKLVDRWQPEAVPSNIELIRLRW